MNTHPWQLNWEKIGILTAILPITVSAALMSATTAPVSAQSLVVVEQGISIGVSQPPSATSFVFGSPIPTPFPVNPYTGLSPNNPYYSYPVRGNVNNSTLYNPILVNPKIRNSTLINPVIVNPPRRQTPRMRGASITITQP